MIDVGRICVKTAGREAGKFCVVVDVLKDRFVLVTGPLVVTHVKRRRCNIEHLEPTPDVIKIAKNASDVEIINVYKKQGIFEKLGTKPPSDKDMELAKEKERKRAVAKKGKPKEPEAKPHEKEKAEKAKPEPKKEEKKEEPKPAKPAEKKPADKKKKKEKPKKKEHKEKKPGKKSKKKPEKPAKAKKAKGKKK